MGVEMNIHMSDGALTPLQRHIRTEASLGDGSSVNQNTDDISSRCNDEADGGDSMTMVMIMMMSMI